MKALNDVCIQKYNISLLVDSNCVGVHENKTFYNNNCTLDGHSTCKV